MAEWDWNAFLNKKSEIHWDTGDLPQQSYDPQEFSDVLASLIEQARDSYSGPNIRQTVQQGLEQRQESNPNQQNEPEPPEEEAVVYPLTPSRADNPEKQKKSADELYKDFTRRQRFKNSKKRVEDLERTMMAATSSPGAAKHRTFVESEAGPEARRRHSIGGNLAYDKKLMEFIQDGNLTNVLNDANIDWADHTLAEDLEANEAEYNKNMSLLVEDQYYPGLIDDAVNKKADFNKVAFCVQWGEDVPEGKPDVVPPSLLEVFDIRVQRETGARNKVFQTSGGEEKSPEMTNFIKFLQASVTAPSKTVINRDEVKLANAVEIDLAASLRSGPQNDLTRAILCLERAEIMNSYDKKLQAAEEAYNKAPAELAERAAIHGESFHANLSGKNVKLSGKSYRPIEVVSYIGLTEPVAPPVHLFKD